MAGCVGRGRIVGVAVVFAAACRAASPPAADPVDPSRLAGGTRDALLALAARLADPALDGRDEGTPGSAVARALIVAQLTACGVAPAGAQGFLQPITTGAGTNVVGRVRGTADHDHVLVVSAHYDHQDGGWWTHPGAQDNAAAVAIGLHVACALAAAPPSRDVLVAFWDAEEPPTFLTDAMGSRYWAAHPTVPIAAVDAVVVMDLMGAGLWDGRVPTFALGVETAPVLAQAVAATAPPEGLDVVAASLSLVEDMVVGRDMVWSDYEVFRRQRIPVLFLTDGQNRRYHTARDTVDALDPARLQAQGAWVGALARGLSEGTVPSWSPGVDHDADLRAVRRLVDAALADPATRAWGDVARGALVAARDSLADDAVPPATVRRAAQRLMCWAGPNASPFTCGLL